MTPGNLKRLMIRTPCFRTLSAAGSALLLLMGLAACGTNESRVDMDADNDTNVVDAGADGTANPDVVVEPDMTGLDGDDLDVNPSDTPGPSDTGRQDVMTDSGECGIPEPEVHRASATACDNERSTDGPFLDPGAEEWSSCTSHDDCTEGENGRCTGNSHDGWNCTYDSCFEDSDCGDGLCACSGGWRSDANVCLGGDCRTDADCGDGSYCSPTFGDCGAFGGVVAYYCRTCEDECVNDSDCGEDPNGWGPGYCMFSQEVGHWLCGYQQCAG